MNPADTARTLEVVGAFIAVAAAVKGTWSPCGLSMLSTLTPLGERSRGRSFRSAAAWFVAGSVAGGLCLGGVLAGLARLAGLAGAPGKAAAAVAGVAALVAVASDWSVVPFSLPVHRRQVNERWLDHYRPWVYGAGFGWQIGSGLATYITSAGVYLLAVVAVASGSPVVALALGALHGAVRGGAVFVSARVTTSAQLLDLHRAVQARAPLAQSAVLLAEVGAAAAAVACLDLVSPIALAVAGAVLAATTVATTLANAARRSRPVAVARSSQPV